ncbi:MAG: hypothetical protein RLZZ419_1763, partial [Pseudomonadota bacterium]
MSKSFNYRPDIDGLRAIAVLLVIFYHAGFSAISGGFIGVDIFFVLSGFLITLILDKEISAGVFSFKSFYLRRIRRLLPALLFVLCVTTIAAFYYLVPGDLIAFGNSLKYSLFSLSNIYFWLNTSSYFSKSINELPLLHTWSLSVEEQFYFVWPITLLVMNRFLSRPTTWILFISGFLLAFGLADWASINKAGAAYYFLPTRAYELMIGAGLALAWDNFPTLNKVQNNLLSIIGLLIIIGTSLLLTENDTFPGINALWPCLGTAFLIASGKNNETLGIVNKALSVKPVVAIGLISYALYLWHWPILAFINYQGIKLTNTVSWLAIGSSLFFAIVSYYFIEKPFRVNVVWSFKQSFCICLLLPIVMSIFISEYINKEEGFKDNYSNLFNPNGKTLPILEQTRLGKLPGSYLGIKKAKVDGLFIGDSIAGAYFNFLNVLATDAGLSIYGTYLPGLPPFFGVSAYTRDDAQDTRAPDKLELNELRIREAAKYNFVLLSADWTTSYPYLTKSAEDLYKTIEYFINSHVQIIILYTPNMLNGQREYNQTVTKLLKTTTLVNYKIKY